MCGLSLDSFQPFGPETFDLYSAIDSHHGLSVNGLVLAAGNLAGGYWYITISRSASA